MSSIKSIVEKDFFTNINSTTVKPNTQTGEQSQDSFGCEKFLQTPKRALLIYESCCISKHDLSMFAYHIPLGIRESQSTFEQIIPRQAQYL